ncbi:MAG: ATP-binding protein [Clostridiales bacterium]|nr:ATP-binding protein [Clostridiales bacterium]
MGFYLNSAGAHEMFCDDCAGTYYVDKSAILNDLVPIVEMGENLAVAAGGNGKKSIKYTCITRPRRFGKTMMANMISAYFGRGADSSSQFAHMKASSCEWYQRHLNAHNVIHISFNDMPDELTTYAQYIGRIKKMLLRDLQMEYPDAGIESDDAVWDALTMVFEYCGREKFIFVLDEWDYIYHQRFVSDSDKESFTKFLSLLLKDRAYVEMAYMTGILPIAKYSSGSELNMFCEYTMATQAVYSEYFGFTDAEVDELYARYLMQDVSSNPRISREDLRFWYDGYQTCSGIRVYNPRSVVYALTNNQIDNYWTSSGPYDELFYYVGANVDEVKEPVGLMVADLPVPAKVQDYAATSMELRTRDEIFSAMVVYGFLNYSDGCVSIPNRELMGKFSEMVKKEASLGSVYQLAKESERMLRATKAGDTKTMAEILQFAHHTISPLNSYNHEAELASMLRWIYLSAIETYRIEREDRAGTGYVDYIFYPFRRDDDALIIELKVDHTVDEAIEQIKDRQYVLRFMGKPGQKPEYTGRVLAVGIAYHRKDTAKRHECRVEVLRDKISL